LFSNSFLFLSNLCIDIAEFEKNKKELENKLLETEILQKETSKDFSFAKNLMNDGENFIIDRRMTVLN
jgi:hypothetical protein